MKLSIVFCRPLFKCIYFSKLKYCQYIQIQTTHGCQFGFVPGTDGRDLLWSVLASKQHGAHVLFPGRSALATARSQIVSLRSLGWQSLPHSADLAQALLSLAFVSPSPSPSLKPSQLLSPVWLASLPLPTFHFPSLPSTWDSLFPSVTF